MENRLETIWQKVQESLNPGIDEAFVKTLGVLLATCSLLGILLNSLTLAFFQKRKGCFSRMFTIIANVDILVSSMTVFISVSYLTGRTPMAFDAIYFCRVWGFIWSLLVKFSAHLVSVVSVLRALAICRPYSAPSRTWSVTGAIVADLIVLFIIETAPLFLNGDYFYFGAIGSCIPNYNVEYIAPYRPKSILLAYIPGLAYFLPIPIILVCFFASMGRMVFRACRKRKQQIGRRKHYFHSMMTMSAFIAAYLICNTPVAIYICSLLFKFLVLKEDAITGIGNPIWSLPYVGATSYILGVPLNSIVNPIIHMSRREDLRGYISDLLSQLKTHFPRPRENLVVIFPVPMETARSGSLKTNMHVANANDDNGLGNDEGDPFICEFETIV